MKNTKRIISMVMVVVLMLALSMSAFASGNVTLKINGSTQGSYSIGSDSTVYDIVNQLSTRVWGSEINAVAAYSPLYDSYSPLYGKYSQKVVYLKSLNGISSAPYTPADGALDDDDYYDPTQTVDSVLQEADAALAEYGGLDYWYGDGYGFAADWEHMIYIGWDWEFTVNGSQPSNPIIPSDPDYGNEFQLTMRESLLENGDVINVYYDYYFVVFDPAHM